jgi:hypothetical protein
VISIVKVKEDLTGKNFGKLTVLYQAEDYVKPDGHRYAKWHCICDCENHTEIDVVGTNLKSGQTQSCGCMSSKNTIGNRNKKYNEYKIIDNIVYIKLSNCDTYTMVDLDKWNEISYIKTLRWWMNHQGYAWACVPKELQKQLGKTKIGLHQIICPCKDDLVTDHIDRNKLNNLTENLRAVTQAENMQNLSIRKDNKSGHTGISLDKRSNKWVANFRLGTFDDINEAIKVYEDIKHYYIKYKEKE